MSNKVKLSIFSGLLALCTSGAVQAGFVGGDFGGFASAGSSGGGLFVASDVDEEGNADAFAEHSFDYVGQGTGTVRVTVDYNLLMESAGVGNQDYEI